MSSSKGSLITIAITTKIFAQINSYSAFRPFPIRPNFAESCRVMFGSWFSCLRTHSDKLFPTLLNGYRYNQKVSIGELTSCQHIHTLFVYLYLSYTICLPVPILYHLSTYTYTICLPILYFLPILYLLSTYPIPLFYLSYTFCPTILYHLSTYPIPFVYLSYTFCLPILYQLSTFPIPFV